MTTLCDYAHHVLTTANPDEKAEKTQSFLATWQQDKNRLIGQVTLPDRPARPEKPELRHTNDMPRRRKAGSHHGKIALLHALAHIELNAIDLAWDVMARFAHYADEHVTDRGFSLPMAFFEDWCKVAKDEAKHFQLLNTRLQELGASYGDLPAHDGLWQSSQDTAHDLPARLAIVPMVLEARGLDVTPAMIKTMQRQGDDKTAEILTTIHDDEITHVRAGTVWFKSWCDHHGLDDKQYWQDLVTTYFKGQLKRPFNDPSRIQAGLLPDWYEPLADWVRDMEDTKKR